MRPSRIAGAGRHCSAFSAPRRAHLRVDPSRTDRPDRDRFVLSRGHAAIEGRDVAMMEVVLGWWLATSEAEDHAAAMAELDAGLAPATRKHSR